MRYMSFVAAQIVDCAVMGMIDFHIIRDAAMPVLLPGDLRDDVGAVAIVFHHFLQSANLTFDAAKAMPIGGFNFGIDAGGFASRMHVASAIRVRLMHSACRL